MLSWSFVVERVKEELALPFQELEYNDEQIKDYLQRNALKKFTTFFPQKWRLTLNAADPDIKVPGRTSEFYLIDPDDREIYNVVEFIPTLGDNIINGHPYFGAWSFSELPEWSLQVFQANNLATFSNFNYTTEFIYPNQVRISPTFAGTCVLEYERSHDPELSTIPTDLHDLFTDLCYGMFGMMVGRIRKKYQNVQTPFGEIAINGDDIYNDCKEVYDRTLEKFTVGSMPNVIFSHG